MCLMNLQELKSIFVASFGQGLDIVGLYQCQINILSVVMYQYWKYTVTYSFIIVLTGLKMASDQKRIKRSTTTYDKTSSAGSKKVFDPQLQSFTKRTSRLISSSNIRENSKQESLTFQKLCQKIAIALDHYYSEDQSGFYVNCREFLSKGVDSWKSKIVDRMNTYEYVEMAVAYKPFGDIEVEIVKEWKRNYLLFAIMTYWYSAIQKIQFHSVKEFQQKYETYRNFIAQISFLIFKNCLSNWQKRLQKQKVSALDKLCQETSHLIITDSSEFKKVYQKVITPLLDRQMVGKAINWEYNLRELQVKKCVFDLQRQESLLKTIQALRKFSKQVKLIKKFQLLREYRMTLQMQLQSQQQAIQLNSRKKKCEVLQKDDFISALIYCVIKGHLDQLQHSMLYMTTLLGRDLAMLSKMQLNAYATDILAVIDFLTIDKLQFQEDKQMDHLKNLAINNRMKIVSSPLIENNDFEDIVIESKLDMKTKHLTEVERSSRT